MNNELDPNIVALFERQSAPPDGERFVNEVSIRIARARRRRVLAESVIRRMPAIALMAMILLVVKILQILAPRLGQALSGIDAFAAVPVASVLPVILFLVTIILYVFRLNWMNAAD
jgi:hypothetical protein